MNLLKWLLTIFFFLILTSEFDNNSIKIVSQGTFKSFQKDSESLSIGRILRSKKDGPFSHGGFLGWNHPYNPNFPKAGVPIHARFDGWGYDLPGLPDKFNYQYYALAYNHPINDYELYFSQSGGQSFLYYLISYVTSTSGERLVSWCRLLNAAFTSLVITGFLYWTQGRFGFFPSLFSFCILLLAPWLILFANNMLYVTGLFYLPMITNLIYLEYFRKKNEQGYLGTVWITACGIFLKCTFAGFDFIIPTLVGAVIPVVLYGYLNEEKSKNVIIMILMNSAAGIAAVAVALFLLIYQLAHFHHSWQIAIDYIINTSERRTYGNQNDLRAIYQASTNSTLVNIWIVYSNATAISLEHIPLMGKIGFILKIKHFLWLFLLLGMLVPYSSHRYRRPLTGLMIATILSLVGPVGWFTIFKFHAISHTHMNFVIWYIPFMLFATVFISTAINMCLEMMKISFFSNKNHQTITL